MRCQRVVWVELMAPAVGRGYAAADKIAYTPPSASVRPVLMMASMGMPFESIHLSRGLQLTASATTKTLPADTCPPPTMPSHLRDQKQGKGLCQRSDALPARCECSWLRPVLRVTMRGVVSPQVRRRVVAAAVLQADRNLLLARPGGRAHARNKQAHAPAFGHAAGIAAAKWGALAASIQYLVRRQQHPSRAQAFARHCATPEGPRLSSDQSLLAALLARVEVWAGPWLRLGASCGRS